MRRTPPSRPYPLRALLAAAWLAVFGVAFALSSAGSDAASAAPAPAASAVGAGAATASPRLSDVAPLPPFGRAAPAFTPRASAPASTGARGRSDSMRAATAPTTLASA